MVVYMYLRKSRADDESMTVDDVLAKHESILQDFCIEKYGHPLEPQYVLKEVVSGETIAGRPQMQLLLDKVANEGVSEVVCLEPQRLTRGDMLDCGVIMRVFKYSNTKIVTPKKTFDLTDKYDSKFLEMEFRQGNEYLEYTKTILQRGRIESVKRGCYLGTYAPYGYDKIMIDKIPTLTINEVEAPFVQLMFDMCAQGYGTAVISNKLNELGSKPRKCDYWTVGSVRDILRNETYTGKVRWMHRSNHIVVDEQGKMRKEYRRNKKYNVYDGLHEAIITEQQFNAVQAVLGSLSKEAPSKELKNIFAGMLKCQCGYSYTYRSYPWARARLNCSHQKFCHTPSIAYEDFVVLFIAALKDRLNDIEVNYTPDAEQKAEQLVKGLTKQLEALEKKQIRLYEFLENGTYSQDVFVDRNAVLQVEREKLEAALEEAKTVRNRQDINVSLHQVLDLILQENISAKKKNAFLKTFIDTIYIDGDTVYINFR